MSISNIKLTMFKLILFIIMLFSFNIIANAEENTKSLNMTLPKDYKSCELTLSFDEAGDYSAVATDVNNKTYEFGKVDDVTMNCVISNAKAGQWTVTVVSEDEIPHYSVTLNGNADTSTQVTSNNISVGKDIVGLQIYFRDQYLVVSWNDDSVGNVNIRVTNLDNSEVIDKTTVDSMYYATEIPSEVKNISVGIVPSSSSTVSNAEKVFTYEVPSYPTDVSVTFPENSYVNSTDVTANVILGSTYSIKAYVNEEEVYYSADNEAGTYDVPITLSQDALNNVALYVIDENGNMFSSQYIFVLDTEAPELTMAADYDNATTTSSSGTLEGTVNDYTSLTINDEEITVMSDGTFQYDYTLHVGDNSFVVKATDEAGNVSEYDITIVRVEEKTDYTMLIIRMVIIILIIIVAIVAINLKNKREDDNYRYAKEKTKTIRHSSERRIDPAKINLITNIILPFIALLYITNFVVSLLFVNTDSMAPTISNRALVVGNRLAYVKNEPQRGDIITFRLSGGLVGKRVIGVAGDSIEFSDGDVYLNGEILEENYLTFDTDTNSTETFTVPDGCVFVLGDNREISEDSRTWTNPYIEIDDIESKVLFIWNF